MHVELENTFASDEEIDAALKCEEARIQKELEEEATREEARRNVEKEKAKKAAGNAATFEQ